MLLLVHVLMLFIVTHRTDAFNALQYTAAVVEHQSSRHTGTFTAWIYKLGSSHESIVDELLLFDSLQTAPKLTMTSMNVDTVDPFQWKPSLIIVEWLDPKIDLLSDIEWDHLKRNVISGEVNVLILHWLQYKKEMMKLVDLFYGLKMHYTRFVSLIDGSVSYYNIFAKKLIFGNAPLLSELFFDQTFDIKGFEVKASFESILVGTTMFHKRKVYGPDIRWISETAKYLNGTVEFTRIKCDKTRIPVIECTKRRISRDGVIYDINLDQYHTKQIHTSNIITAQPDKIVIMAPRGRRLSALEMFAVPFSGIVWLLMTLLVAICWITTWMLPNLMVNDPVFVSIFGIEKISIHDTSRHEKLILLFLILLFFFLTNAFESKLISLMANYPHVQNPKTLQDLHRMNLKFRIAENHSVFYFTDPELNRLLEIVSVENVTIDQHFAQIGDEEQMDILMNDVDHYDFEARRSRFVKLENFHFGIVHRQHRIRTRSPLAHQFVRSDRLLFETGIRQHWTTVIKHSYHLSSHFEFNEVSVDSNDELDLSALQPAWYVMAIGLMTSLMIFFVERMTYRAGQRSKIRKRDWNFA